MRCLDLPTSHATKKEFVKPLLIMAPPESKDLDRIMEEILMEFQELALEGLLVEMPDGITVSELGGLCDSAPPHVSLHVLPFGGGCTRGPQEGRGVGLCMRRTPWGSGGSGDPKPGMRRPGGGNGGVARPQT
jgi:hypothetical protein